VGYNTNWDGYFVIEPKLSQEHYDHIEKFCNTRHEDKNGKMLYRNYGISTVHCDLQLHSISTATILRWNGSEKTYNLEKWVEYLIKNFFKPNGYKLNGEMTWQGEGPDDRGKVVVKDNKLEIKQGRIVYN